MDDLTARAQAWLAEDPDPETWAALDTALANGDRGELAAAFGSSLAFGTAGIRGPLGPGPARMNRLVVRRVTAGLAARLAVDGAPEDQVVVVGRDARHKSQEFADDVAGVLLAAGFGVLAFSEPVPTPLLAFAVRRLGAAAGVQVTASHNPPADNGYKLYWSGGAQINAPLDAEIADAIDVVTAEGPIVVAQDRPDEPPSWLRDAYLEECRAVPVQGAARSLRIVYTAMHGVAGATVTEALAAAGFDDVHAVAEQFDPDPDFPTVGFPNPEEPGALDLAVGLAREVGADVVLANDPDGDRIAVVVPGASGWRPLSGDETGCLLAEDLLSRGTGRDRFVATTVVSSQLLARIAAAHGVRHEETLTGFKWLAPAMADARSRGLEPVLAYEQALGVMVGDTVLDKDGITAAVAVADLAARLKASGRTVDDALDDLARAHGVHATLGRSVRLADPAEGAVAVERLLDGPPGEVAGVAVAAVVDHRAGVRRFADGSEEPLPTPATPLAGLELADGSRVQARPSGTEPLLKCYVEAVEQVGPDGVEAARTRATGHAEALASGFLAILGHA
jgi:phosphomannomutase